MSTSINIDRRGHGPSHSARRATAHLDEVGDEYTDEFYSHLRSNRNKTLILPHTYLLLRESLIQIIFHAPFPFSLDTLLLAVGLMDLYASRRGYGMHSDLPELVAGVALMTASKYEENQERRSGFQIVSSILGIYAESREYKNAFKGAEKLFLRVIEWDVSIPGPLPFLRCIVDARIRQMCTMGRAKEIRDQCEFIRSKHQEKRAMCVAEHCAQIAMMRNDFVAYPPNTIAWLSYKLSVYIVEYHTVGNHQGLIHRHYTEMAHLASEAEVSGQHARRMMNSLLFHVLYAQLSNSSYFWRETLPELRWAELKCLHDQLLEEENVYQQALMRGGTYWYGTVTCTATPTDSCTGQCEPGGHAVT